MSWRSRKKLHFYCNLNLKIPIANSSSFCVSILWVDRFRHVCQGLFTCRQMDYSDRAVCGVDMLASGSTRSLSVYPQVLWIYGERYLTEKHKNIDNLFLKRQIYRTWNYKSYLQNTIQGRESGKNKTQKLKLSFTLLAFVHTDPAIHARNTKLVFLCFEIMHVAISTKSEPDILRPKRRKMINGSAKREMRNPGGSIDRTVWTEILTISHDASLSLCITWVFNSQALLPNTTRDHVGLCRTVLCCWHESDPDSDKFIDPKKGNSFAA